ncbi:MAG TPA: DUF58 domain-containing protein [Planctomycetaceae bacterium]|nr:DUF58 domain-containing protein [Planctomycetaceae bacterium]
MTRDSKRFLQPETIARIARLEIVARNVVEGFLSGGHRSPYFGQSIEFAQHREYVPGDDIRRIDWKVWSKTDKYYIKQYEEETNLRTTLVVDVSESMQFGGDPNKCEYACRAAASLAYLLLKQSDAVGLVTFDEAVRQRVQQSSKFNHLTALLAALDASAPKQKTSMSDVLFKVAEEYARRGLIVVISDLLTDQAGLRKGLKLLRTRGHDVMVFHILDDAELDFPYTGTTRFEGLEAAGDLVCDPRSLRDSYLAAMTKFLEEIHRFCAQHLIDYQTIRTSEHLSAVLAHYLSHRVGMRQSIRS